MKTATMTFHAAHNYGSSLQAYALQRTILELGHDNEIIDFRTSRQTDMYRVFTKRKGIKYVVKNLIRGMYYTPLQEKHHRFERFIDTKLLLTRERYTSLQELEQAAFDFDCYIAGSDQIWNPIPMDFDWSYYLPFVKHGKRIAYAPSFGPLSTLGDDSTQKQIREYVSLFDGVTVRDNNAAEKMRKLDMGDPKVVVDPTLLLDKASWEALVPQKRVHEGRYIFFYTLFADHEMIAMVKALSQKLGLPVVVSNFSNHHDAFNTFLKHYDAGPLEFLNLIYHAEAVITSSFHGTVFSVIFQKALYSIRGATDARISTLLNNLGMIDLTVSSVEDIRKRDAVIPDYCEIEQKLRYISETSKDILRDMLMEGKYIG